MSVQPVVRPILTRLQASAVMTLLDDLDSIVLGTELMPEEFWQHLNAAALTLKAELWAGIDTGVMQ
jgi:hypothetical protein